MNTAEEILRDNIFYKPRYEVTFDEAILAMKEYANQVAKDTLNRALLSINYDEVPTKYIEIIRTTPIQLP